MTTWRNSFGLGLTVALVIVVLGCGTNLESGKLTPKKAEQAVNQWASSNGGSATVQGIQELPQQNSAKATVQLVDVTLRLSYTTRVYSGPAEATFVRYNDGRWIMTGITTAEGFKSVRVSNLQIEAR